MNEKYTVLLPYPPKNSISDKGNRKEKQKIAVQCGKCYVSSQHGVRQDWVKKAQTLNVWADFEEVYLRSVLYNELEILRQYKILKRVKKKFSCSSVFRSI